MQICELEQILFGLFPKDDAESWDHVGLSVGRPSDEVVAVACALDATPENVRTAHALGANVLVTHHPVYIKAPDAFTPESPCTPQAGAAVYTAAELGVSIISDHTNLDRSREARAELSERMGFKAFSSLEFPQEPERTGLGALCDIEACSLDSLARKAAAVFGGSPRVWGSADSEVRRVAFLGGSLGEFGEYAIGAGADAVVTGECGYHVAQDLSARGLGVVLLGHDRSEEPFVNILARALESCGVAPTLVHTIEGPKQWWTVTEGELS